MLDAWSNRLLMIALVGITLSGCNEPVAPTQTESATAGKPLKVLFAGALNNVPMMVAAENGYWREQGLDVTVQVLDSGSQIATALVSGAADIGAGTATSSIPLSRAAGNQLTFVGPYHNNPMVVNGVARVAVIGSTKSGVKAGDAKSLVGKTIGASLGSTSESYLKSYLASRGVGMGDVKLVNLSVPDMSVALTQGNADAVVPWEPYVSQIIREQGDKAAVVSRGGPYGSSVVGVMVTDKYFAQNRDLVERYVAGAWKGVQFTRQNPAAAATIAQRYIQGLNHADATSGLQAMQAEFDPRISPCTKAAVMQEQDSLIAANAMKIATPFPYETIVQADFIQSLLTKHPELLNDLKPLPETAAQCGGLSNAIQ
ncbi:ABC transporter substrate-binding protein [Microvirga zambiensis]|uniref:ABC transporter substrate-binding protein n=1 Tax=Microvirga zambiensis TaxID=1402137 RepID=UPI00191FE9C0|nr:NrtA/SsuA/CpmA family ABC transporter substrate-binding protein [Microvirga zambiensis]